MKKTMILLAALSSVAFAFNDTTWSFEDSIAPDTLPIGGLTSTYLDVNTTGTATASFADSGMTTGTKVGNYELTADLGKALTMTDGQYVKLGGQAYWSNGNGKLWLGDSATNDFTLMTWVNFSSLTGEVYLFGTGDGNGSGLGFLIHDGKLDLLAKGQAHHDFTGTYTLSTDTWVNLAITYDHATGEAIAYVNGDQIGSITGLNQAQFDGKSTFTSPGGTCAYIGAASTHTAQDTFAGQMAEFKILDGALNQVGILQAAHLTPEPATATLSLLALAGLAARRKRH